MRCDIWSGGGPVAGIPILVIQQTMLLLAVLAMRAILPHFTRWRHIMLLWYVVLIRLAIPFPLPDPFSLLKHPSAPASYVPQATPTSDFAQAGSDWLETDAGRVALCVWTAIAVALLACQAASLLRWKRSHTQLSPVDDPDILAFADSYWRNPKHSLVTRAGCSSTGCSAQPTRMPWARVRRANPPTPKPAPHKACGSCGRATLQRPSSLAARSPSS